MGPAQQRFSAGNLTDRQIDFGLIVQREFVAFQSATQTFFDGLPRDRALVHGRLEKFIAVMPVLFSLIHGEIGIFYQCFGVPAIVGIDADADAGGDVQIVVIDPMRFAYGLEYSSRGDGGIFCLFDFGKQNHKFVATLAAYCVGGSHASQQALGDGLKQFVTERMAQRIVDVFEAVQIEKKMAIFFA